MDDVNVSLVVDTSLNVLRRAQDILELESEIHLFLVLQRDDARVAHHRGDRRATLFSPHEPFHLSPKVGGCTDCPSGKGS